MLLTALLFLGGAAAYGARVAGAQLHLVVDVAVPILVFAAFAVVGAIVAARRPDHPIGWLLLGAGWLLALSQLANTYTHHAVLMRPASTSSTAWVAWLEGAAFFPAFMVLVFVLPLLFPDGRLPSPRWRLVAWPMAIVLPAGILIEGVLRPGPLSSFPRFTNPLGVASLAPIVAALDTWLAPLVYGPLLVAAGAAVVTRLVRSDTVERRQFAWVAFPMALLLVFIPLNEAGLTAAHGLLGVLGGVMFVVAFGGLPVGIGIAVLRYRLYEIDRIVSRTATYTLVTLALVGVYAGSSVAVAAVMHLVTGQTSNDLVVAASTLTVAALFNPLRRRAQDLVDRRFSRSRYDVRQTVEAFTARLRDNVDLGDMEADLKAVVRDTFRPAAVSMWLPGDVEATQPPGAGSP